MRHDGETRQSRRMKFLIQHPVADDVLDIVRHHRDHKGRELSLKAAMAHCRERAPGRRRRDNGRLGNLIHGERFFRRDRRFYGTPVNGAGATSHHSLEPPTADRAWRPCRNALRKYSNKGNSASLRRLYLRSRRPSQLFIIFIIFAERSALNRSGAASDCAFRRSALLDFIGWFVNGLGKTRTQRHRGNNPVVIYRCRGAGRRCVLYFMTLIAETLGR